MKKKLQDKLDKFVKESQKEKMKELWDNPRDERLFMRKR